MTAPLLFSLIQKLLVEFGCSLAPSKKNSASNCYWSHSSLNNKYKIHVTRVEDPVTGYKIILEDFSEKSQLRTRIDVTASEAVATKKIERFLDKINGFTN